MTLVTQTELVNIMIVLFYDFQGLKKLNEK